MTAEPPGREPVGVLDTNAVILFEHLDLAELPQQALITAVTLAELSAGPLLTDDPAERSTRQARLQVTEANFDPLPFDSAAARAYGTVATALRRAGRRKPAARAFDAMIAATAIANALPLYTANPRDFAGIDGLDVHPIASPKPRT